jgi:hypothetical protein
MSYFNTPQSKAELGLDYHDFSSDDEEYEKYATFHRECRDNPKLMPYVEIEEESGTSVDTLRRELNYLLRWRDEHKSFLRTESQENNFKAIIERINVIKGYLY